MSEEVNQMLQADDKGVAEATGTLSKLFRQILLDVGVTPMQWSKLMQGYLTNPRNRVPKNGRDRSTHRGNLNKELRKPNMTWNNFKRGLIFLSPVKIRFEVHLTWNNKRTTLHGVTLTNRTFREEPDEDNHTENEGEV